VYAVLTFSLIIDPLPPNQEEGRDRGGLVVYDT